MCVFFRARTLVDAVYFFTHFFSGSWADVGPTLLLIGKSNISATGFYYVTLFSALAIGIVAVLCMDLSINRSMKAGMVCLNPIGKLSRNKRWAVYWLFGILTAMFYLIANTGVSGAGQFIYMGY